MGCKKKLSFAISQLFVSFNFFKKKFQSRCGEATDLSVDDGGG